MVLVQVPSKAVEVPSKMVAVVGSKMVVEGQSSKVVVEEQSSMKVEEVGCNSWPHELHDSTVAEVPSKMVEVAGSKLVQVPSSMVEEVVNSKLEVVERRCFGKLAHSSRRISPHLPPRTSQGSCTSQLNPHPHYTYHSSSQLPNSPGISSQASKLL